MEETDKFGTTPSTPLERVRELQALSRRHTENLDRIASELDRLQEKLASMRPYAELGSVVRGEPPHDPHDA